MLAYAYCTQSEAYNFLDFRKDALGVLAQNIMASVSEGLPVLSTLDNHQRHWISFMYLVDQNIKKVLTASELDWDIEQLRSLDRKEHNVYLKALKREFKKDSVQYDLRLQMFLMIRTCKRSDYDLLVSKLDPLAYKFWKQEIAPEEYVAQSALIDERDN
jgi:hypothetical protein